MHLSGEKLRDHADHVDIAVETVCPETETSKYFQSVAHFFEIFVGDLMLFYIKKDIPFGPCFLGPPQSSKTLRIHVSTILVSSLTAFSFAKNESVLPL